MARFLIHIHTGPADPNKATPGCLIAATAAQEGHETRIFLAGDGVHLLAPATLAALEGPGTGRLAEHVARFAQAGGQFSVSARSSQARGYDATLLDGHPAEFCLPDRLVAYAAEADTVLCY
ncbi:DsrE family protein [Brevirhabdus sp.]|uniref:DsrE family protein n=1 Tax=Brevirhabdus sp. TaxID=2004514 RepID=UPI004058E8B3